MTDRSERQMMPFSSLKSDRKSESEAALLQRSISANFPIPSELSFSIFAFLPVKNLLFDKTFGTFSFPLRLMKRELSNKLKRFNRRKRTFMEHMSRGSNLIHWNCQSLRDANLTQTAVAGHVKAFKGLIRHLRAEAENHLDDFTLNEELLVKLQSNEISIEHLEGLMRGSIELLTDFPKKFTTNDAQLGIINLLVFKLKELGLGDYIKPQTWNYETKGKCSICGYDVSVGHAQDRLSLRILKLYETHFSDKNNVTTHRDEYGVPSKGIFNVKRMLDGQAQQAQQEQSDRKRDAKKKTPTKEKKAKIDTETCDHQQQPIADVRFVGPHESVSTVLMQPSMGGGQHSVRFPHHQIVSTDVCSAGISSQSVPPGFIFPSMGVQQQGYQVQQNVPMNVDYYGGDTSIHSQYQGQYSAESYGRQGSGETIKYYESNFPQDYVHIPTIGSNVFSGSGHGHNTGIKPSQMLSPLKFLDQTKATIGEKKQSSAEGDISDDNDQ